MKKTLQARTLTASLQQEARALFAWIADPDNLTRWHGSFCRSLRKENGLLIAESPRGPVTVRLIRDDHSFLLDIFMEVAEGIDLTNSIRILSNGEGSEMVWTLIRPEGIPDSVFHEHLRWAGSALHNLRKASMAAPVPASTSSPNPAFDSPGPAGTTAALQEPSPAEISSMPVSGKKLFVGNLSYAWSDDQLRAHFAEVGVVKTAEMARFRGRGGRSRGFGFVEMATEAEAQAAIEKINGSTAGGRQVIVRLAKSQESRPAKALGTAPEAGSPRLAGGGQGRGTRPAAQRPRSERARRPGRPRPDRPPAVSSAASPYARRLPGRSASPQRAYQGQDITNKSGYEIFPRRAPGSTEPPRPSSAAPEPARPQGEPSPYMEDTGDIENHGNRPPRRHRRPDR